MQQDTHTHANSVSADASSRTPIFLVFGQSNAGLLSSSGGMQTALDAAGSGAVLLTVAGGGTSVAKPDGDWNIISGDGYDAPGDLFSDLLVAVDGAKLMHPDAYIAGAVWVQGESDRNADNDYYTATKTLFDTVRADLKEDFPISIVGLSDLQQGSNRPGHAHVVDAQMQLASDLPYVHFLDTNQLIATSGMTDSEIMRDTLHYNSDFYELIADAVLDQPVMQEALGLATPDTSGNMSGHGASHAGTGGALTAPGVGASAADIQTYLDALADLAEAHVHDEGSPLAAEHMAVIDLVPRDAATHVAISDGDWDNPAIWSNGEVPGEDAKVLIPQGVTVNYGSVREEELFTLRIDGKLSFATDVDSKMVFDTMIVAPDGHLEIGTMDNPVDPAVTIDLVVADNGAIDTNWDPLLLSRGIVSHGRAEIHGAKKDSHEKVLNDPAIGDQSVTFNGLPEGWQVGDTIVIAGTRFDGHKWDNDIRDVRFHESEDEVRVISRIDGGTVYFDDPLEHDHGTPRADLKTSVANYTRNVSVESESGEQTETFARGHVMFMHSDEVDVRYAEFNALGRTDKSEPSVHVSTLDEVSFDSNIQGRYALHLHRTGVDDLDNPTLLQGNAVYGSPGWGIVHHDANALIDNNATYNTFGAGFIAETGNETGAWTNNIAIFAEGVGWGKPKNLVNLDIFDTANGGDGFWFQGRLVDAENNIAASVNHGYVYFHRGPLDRMIDVQSENFAFAGALDGAESSVDDVPIRVFSDNETFAANEGLHVVKANINQGHDVWTTLENLTAWEVRTGAQLEYTSHYNLTGFDVIGKEAVPFSRPLTGIKFGPNITEMVVVDASIEGFPTGIDLEKNFVGMPQDPGGHDYFIINPTFTDVDLELNDFDSVHDTVINDPGIATATPSLSLEGPLTYSDDYLQPTGRRVVLDGTKTDSLGETEFPGGVDDFDISYTAVLEHLKSEGYWMTPAGQSYFIIEVFFTDRLTGDVYVEKHPVFMNDNLRVDNAFSRYFESKYNGVQDLVEMPDGTAMAGETVLGIPQTATPFGHLNAETDTQNDGHNQGADEHNGHNGHGDDEEITPVVEIVPVNVAPSITSAQEVSVSENQTAVVDVNASDDTNREGSGLTFSLSGGADQSLFGIDASTGEISFNTAPDFEGRDDADRDNIFDVEVTVTDRGGLTDTQAISVAVTDVEDSIPSEPITQTPVAPTTEPTDEYDNVLTGDDENNPIRGTDGNDWIDGKGGNDKINGGNGNDFIIAGYGNDWFVRGGLGADIFQFGIGDGDVKIVDFEEGVDKIYLAGSLSATDLAVSTQTYKGISTVVLKTGTGDRLMLHDKMEFDLEGDIASFTKPISTNPVSSDPVPNSTEYDNIITGTANNEVLSGTEQDDWISGQSGNDKINGGDGDDYIIAGSGNDWFVRGGNGSDIFQFGIGDGDLKIYDFEDGVDLINLTGGLTFNDLALSTHTHGDVSTLVYSTSNGDRLMIRDEIAANIDESDLMA